MSRTEYLRAQVPGDPLLAIGYWLDRARQSLSMYFDDYAGARQEFERDMDELVSAWQERQRGRVR